jgi:hypothetical protein
MRFHILRTQAFSIIILMLLVGCSDAKPVFDTPSIIIDHPVIRDSSLSISSIETSHAQVSSSAPPSLLINVPFAPQSPFAVWDALHEEACEEMALIMVYYYLKGMPLSLEDAEREVQALIAWERENGYADDVSAAELGDIATAFYGLRARVMTNVTEESLKNELTHGNPVIIPAGGRMLKNPYFSGEGPFYHMLVVTGYDSRGFITNDPGTKRGEEYWYATDVLMNAIHDWTGVKEEIAQGEKNALVVELR